MKTDNIQTSFKSNKQLVYLDFDGEVTKYHNSDLGISLPVLVQNSGFSQERILTLVAELNQQYSEDDIEFTAIRPVDVEFSTVYIGKSSSFETQGDFLGIAETIDESNRIKNDNAFVFLDSVCRDDEIISVINHEIEHIAKGNRHAEITGTLADYAAICYSEENRHDELYNDTQSSAPDLGIQTLTFVYSGSTNGSTDFDYICFTAGVTGTLTISQYAKSNTEIHYDSSINSTQATPYQNLSMLVEQGKKYYFVIKNYNIYQTAEFYYWQFSFTQQPAVDTEPPSTPTNLKLNSSFDSIANMEWDDSTDNIRVVAYQIRYGKSSNLSNAEINYVGLNTFYGLYNLSSGTYYWQVRACDSAGNESAWSAVQSFSITVDIQAPTIPGGLTKTIAKSTAFLDWNDSTDNVLVSGYQFRYGTNSNLDNATIYSTSNSNYNLTELAEGTYYWQVRAFDNAVKTNYSEWSSVQSFTIKPPDTQAPTTPTDLTYCISAFESDTIILDWADSYDNENVAGYEYRFGIDSSVFPYTTFSTSTSEGSLRGLTDGIYYWQVRAYDSYNNYSAWSQVQRFVKDFLAPTTPANLTVKISSDLKSATFSWTESADNIGIEKYRFWYGPVNAQTSADLKGTYLYTTTNSISVSGLTAGKEYIWKVIAYDLDNHNSSAWSDFQKFIVKTEDNTPPTTPEVLKTTITGNDVLCGWNDSVDNKKVVGYEILYGVKRPPWWIGRIPDPITVTSNMYLITDLEEGEYYWRVRAFDEEKCYSDWTVTQSFCISGKETHNCRFLSGNILTAGKNALIVHENGILSVYQSETQQVSQALDCREIYFGCFEGKSSLLYSDSENLVYLAKYNSTSSLFETKVINYISAGWEIAGIGDFNGNGTDDVLILNPNAASSVVGLIGFWEDGKVWNLINGFSPDWDVIATEDFNGDGKTDMLWKNSFIGEGGKTYNAYCTWIVDDAIDWRMVSVANPEEWNVLCSGDFNGDDTADIAMINGEGVVGIWGINNGYLSSWSILSAVDTNTWNFAGAGDFNGDGTDDIAWCNMDTNLAGYWQINDKQLTSWQTIGTLA